MNKLIYFASNSRALISVTSLVLSRQYESEVGPKFDFLKPAVTLSVTFEFSIPLPLHVVKRATLPERCLHILMSSWVSP